MGLLGHNEEANAHPSLRAAINAVGSPSWANITSKPLVDAADYGLATGNSAAANLTALQNAVAAIPATGGRLLLQPGTYSINPWTITGVNNLSFVGNGAVLSCATGFPLTVQGTITGAATTVTAAISRGANTITVASSAGLAVGDLLVIRSSGEVFNPERPTQYFKGELAWVAAISGTTVTLESRTFDSYSTSYTITVDKVAPVKGTTIRDLQVVGGGAGQGQIGIRLQYFDGAIVENCSVSACEFTGILGRLGYRFIVQNNRVTGANQSGLGYGVRVTGVDHAHLDGNMGRKNRHSIDVDWDQTVSRFVDITNNQANNDSSAGISTHGGAEFVTITDNFMRHCGGGLVVRSGSTLVEGNRVRGTKTTTESSETYTHGITIGDDQPNVFGVGIAGSGLVINDNDIDVTHPALGGVDTFGIYLTTSLTDARVSDNRIHGFSTYGIYHKGDVVNGAGIIGNTVDCTSMVGTAGTTFAHGIYFAPAHNTVSGNNQTNLLIAENDVRGALYSSIRVNGNVDSAAPSDTVMIVDNILRGYGLRGVDMISGYFSRVRIERNLHPGSTSIANRLAYSPANFTYQPALETTFSPTTLAAGEYTQDRVLATQSDMAHPGSGVLWLTYFTATQTDTVANVRVSQGNTGAGATPTLIRVGVYLVNGDNSITLVGSTANNTTLWPDGFNANTLPLTSSFVKQRGARYAVGILIVSTAGMPTFYGAAGSSGEFGREPKVCSQVTGQTDLPSTVAAGSLSTSAPGRWFLAAVTP